MVERDYFMPSNSSVQHEHTAFSTQLEHIKHNIEICSKTHLIHTKMISHSGINIISSWGVMSVEQNTTIDYCTPNCILTTASIPIVLKALQCNDGDVKQLLLQNPYLLRIFLIIGEKEDQFQFSILINHVN